MRHAILIMGFLTVFHVAPASAGGSGLERFERDVKPFLVQESIGITYQEAEPLGGAGFVLGGVILTVPPGETSVGGPDRIAIDRLVVENIDFDRIVARQTPGFLRLRADGIQPISDDTGSEFALMMKRHDVPNVPFGLIIDYRHDPARKVFTLAELALMLPGLARVDFTMVLDGVASLARPRNEQAEAAAAAEVSVRAARLIYDDASLMGRIVTEAARGLGMTPEALVEQAVSLLRALGAGQPAETLDVFDALVSFVQDWRQPAGPVRVSLDPPGKIGQVDLQRIAGANAIKDVLGLSVHYAGTRAGAGAVP
jgi:hypothetical protein